MRRMTRRLTLVAIACALVGTPVLAAQHSGAAKRPAATAHGPKTTTSTTKVSAPKGAAVKATTQKAQTVRAPKAQTPKTTGATPKGPKPQASTSKGATLKSAGTSTSKKGGGAATPPGSISATTRGSTTSAGTWTPTNPIAEKLSTKTNLLNRVTASLPQGTDLNAATFGFKNFGQFVAAVNVSGNLGIPFADLKSAMTGTALDGTPTGIAPLSLGQAIHQLRPGVDAETEAQKATIQADVQIGSTSTTPSSTSKVKPKSPKRPGGSL